MKIVKLKPEKQNQENDDLVGCGKSYMELSYVQEICAIKAYKF